MVTNGNEELPDVADVLDDPLTSASVLDDVSSIAIDESTG
jgi:hypothetical protein